MVTRASPAHPPWLRRPGDSFFFLSFSRGQGDNCETPNVSFYCILSISLTPDLSPDLASEV